MFKGSVVVLSSFLILGALAAPTSPASAEGSVVWSKFFSPSTIGPGSTSMLTFDIANSSGTPASAMAFDDELPSGVELAAPAFVSNTCDGSVTIDEDDADSGFDIRLTGGKLGPTSSCTIVVNVTDRKSVV